MKFLALMNQDTGKLGGLVIRDNTGRLFFTAVNSWLLNTLDVLLTPSKFKYEIRQDERTIKKVEIDKKSESILDVLKTRILPPYIPYATGVIKEVQTPQQALEKAWSAFSSEEHQEVKES